MEQAMGVSLDMAQVSFLLGHAASHGWRPVFVMMCDFSISHVQ